MRKRIIDSPSSDTPKTDANWLVLEPLATVEVTSETAAHPIEGALILDSQTGWRASTSGEQTIRLIFDVPQRIQRIFLRFTERDIEREQEFVLRWSADSGQSFRELVRQQWNFNPNNASDEIEDYHVDLSGVTQLELCIIPDRSKGSAVASLEQLRLA